MGCTLSELSQLRCMKKHTGLSESPVLEPCFNRRDEVIALFCNVCHGFYVVVGMEPIRYPKKLLPGYVEPFKMNAQQRGELMRARNEERQGQIIGERLRFCPECWHTLWEIGEPGEMSWTRTRDLLERLVKHGFVVHSMEKMPSSKRKQNVWMLVPTWKDTIPCDHDHLCVGFWKGVKPTGR